ncbi:mannosyl-oligosaccharide alpha-1,2-mannosidase [Actinomortierella wolfii]|nr:mannosyl-oligosaccharide alpha-1,2-mannosidase [Actinomortierella wolfii]
MAQNAKAGAWESLEPKLSQPTLDAVAMMGFTDMTPVQSGAIPLFMKNKDVVVEAVTGSGKTLSFLIPILEKIHRRSTKLAANEIGAIVISPTRELASQIAKVLSDFDAFYPNIRHQLVIGGETSLEEDIATFHEVSPDILIGTPGRLEDMLSQKRSGVNAKELEVLVLDEADRLLDMGFTASLNKIMSMLPKQRRTGLFSATMTDGLTELVRAGLRNPVRIVVKVEDLQGGGGQRTPASLHIGYILCQTSQKLLLLTHLLRQEAANKKTIVYFATCASVDYFYKLLSKLPQLQGFHIHSLHGKMETKKRTLTFQSFTNIPAGSPGVLLCTDVASRGLDIPDVDFVIQVDPPQDPKAFTHRCGRAGRAGREGKAVVFLVKGKEETYVNFLQIRKVPMQRWGWNGGPTITENVDEDDEEDGDDNTRQGDDQQDDNKIGARERLEPEDDEETATFLRGVRKVVMTDRDLHDKGTMAYVSFVRSYSKHEASFIFRAKDLDLGALARGYGLLRLPKMPELAKEKMEGGRIPGFEPADLDMDTYKYVDKQKEAQRLKKLEQHRAKLAEKAKQELEEEARNGKSKNKKVIAKTTAWSHKLEAKERKMERQLKKQRKRDFLKRKAAGEIDEEAEEEWRKKRNKQGAESEKGKESSDAEMGSDGDDDDEDSWEALQREERLAKKLRQGKISKKDFEKQVVLILASIIEPHLESSAPSNKASHPTPSVPEPDQPNSSSLDKGTIPSLLSSSTTPPSLLRQRHPFTAAENADNQVGASTAEASLTLDESPQLPRSQSIGSELSSLSCDAHQEEDKAQEQGGPSPKKESRGAMFRRETDKLPMYDGDEDDKYGKTPFNANKVQHGRFRLRKRHAVLAACLFGVGYVMLKSNGTTARLPSNLSYSSSKGQQYSQPISNNHFLQEKYSGPGVAIGGGPGAQKAAGGGGGGGGAPKEKKKKKKAPPTLFEFNGKEKSNKNNNNQIHEPAPVAKNPPPPPPPVASEAAQIDHDSGDTYSDEDDENPGVEVEVENESHVQDKISTPVDQHSSPDHSNSSADDSVWRARQQSVKDAFVYAWNAYKRDAWGKDEYHPIAKFGSNMITRGQGFTIVDSLDTILLMGLEKEFAEARAWVRDELTFDQDNSVNLFETTIRVLGGLLSAYDQSGGDKVFLDKAVDLADRLMAAFETPTGIPYSSVNLKDRRAIPNHDMGGASSTSEVSTIQLEFKYLSYLTGDTKYWKAAEKVIHLMKDMESLDGLVPIYINANQGRFHGGDIRLGSRGDSYYEYLLKQYLQTGKTESIYREMYDQTVVGIKKHLVGRSIPNNLLFIGEINMHNPQHLSPKMDHLVCFLGGTLALGATEGLPLSRFPNRVASLPNISQQDFKMGEELTRSCYEMYRQTDTGLASEIVVWVQDKSDIEGKTALQHRPGSDFYIKDLDGHNWLRPEAVESLFYMWRFTGDEKYRQWGWEIFEAIEKYSKVPSGGYSSIHDIRDRNNIRFSDKMETFFLAETLKYLYLLFGPNDVVPLDKYVFNTEAHPFPIFTPTAAFLDKLRHEPSKSSPEQLLDQQKQQEQLQEKLIKEDGMADNSIFHGDLTLPDDDEDDAIGDEVDQGLNEMDLTDFEATDDGVPEVEVDYEQGEEDEMDETTQEPADDDEAVEKEDGEEDEEEDDGTVMPDEFGADNEEDPNDDESAVNQNDWSEDDGDDDDNNDDGNHGDNDGYGGSL